MTKYRVGVGWAVTKYRVGRTNGLDTRITGLGPRSTWLGCDKILSWGCLGCDKILSWGWLGCDKILSK